MLSSVLRGLVEVKVASLLHDPPHKSHLIHILGERFRELHAREAVVLKEVVLKDTKLATISKESLELAAICDRLASSVERRFIRASYLGRWPRGVYLRYDRLHNIFDPRRSDPITINIKTFEELESRVLEVARGINKILVEVDKVVDEVTLYNTLYALFEPAWYAKGLPPSLADTRVPTHTAFDHLYASAMVANIVSIGHSYKLSGYFVLVDFPGIQSFVGSGRKAGDFWAASWLLSNIMWKLGSQYALKYGFDVVVSPTPRLNPYTIKTLRDALADKAPNALNEIVELYVKATGLSREDFEFIVEQPIIPATISLLIPPLGHSSPEEVASGIKRAYREAWRAVVGEVESDLARSGSTTSRLLRKLLRDIVELPPQGVRIYVIDVARLHEGVNKCLTDGVKELCEDVGLEVSEGDYKEFMSLPQEVRRELATALFWHLLVTETTKLARKFGVVEHPTPRAFFVYSHGKLVPVSERIVDSRGDWIHCTLCGLEPAVIKASKKPGAPDEYSDEFKERVAEILGEGAPVDWRELKIHLKPGEALGPYCLLKRAIYISKRATGKVRFISTDDIALKGISTITSRLDREHRVLKTLGEELRNKLPEPSIVPDALKLITEEGEGVKDISLTAEASGLMYEAFIESLEEAFQEACKKLGKDVSYINSLINTLREVILDDVAIAKDLLTKPELSKLLSVERVCRAYRPKTTYGILRGDADNIGRILRGEVGLIPGGLSLKDYLNVLYEKIAKSIEQSEYSHEVKEAMKASIEGSLKLLQRGLELLGFKNKLPVTPAWTSSLSLSLIVSALMDFKVVTKNYGMLVFSGGDDALALVPPETAFKAAVEIRCVFNDEGFLHIEGSGLIAPSIPTGRSISLRFVDIKDHMNFEYEETLKLLEERAKEAKWVKGDVELFKDSLVISDSRSNIATILPLNAYMRQSTVDTLALSLLIGIGALSTGIPEDFANYVPRPEDIESSGLKKIATYVLKRNITLSGERKEAFIKELTSGLEEIASRASEVYLELEGERANLLVQVLSTLKILRRHI
jgi:CRISPR-associated protein Cmr2